MIEQQRQRIERAVTDMIDDMDKSHLRKMQVKSQMSLGIVIRFKIFHVLFHHNRLTCIGARQNAARTPMRV